MNIAEHEGAPPRRRALLLAALMACLPKAGWPSGFRSIVRQGWVLSIDD